MLTQSQIKRLKSLHNKKYRQKEGKILLEGHRLILQALIADVEIIKVWMAEDYAESISGRELKQMLVEKNIVMEMATKKSIGKVCDSKNSQGIIAVMLLPQYAPLQDIPRHSLYFDNISDPGNMGTLLRTAAWFGISSVFLSSGCVDPLNSKVLRSAMGAHFYLKTLLTIAPDDLFEKYMKAGYSIISADIKGESLHNLRINLSKEWILILGSEAHGISDSLRSYITHSISISGAGGMESLNVGVAGGILLHALLSSTKSLQTEKK